MKKQISQSILAGLCILTLVLTGCDQISSDDNGFTEEGTTAQTDDSYNSSGTDTGGTSGTVSSQWPPSGFSEEAADQNIIFPDTVATVVSVVAPLPGSVPEHPTECDVLYFLRIRHILGPENPSDADRILIAQPGGNEGASAFYNVAANLVTRAYNEKDKYIEFWTVDRRSNCLEDHNGLEMVKETGDPHDFIDYYYRGKEYKGQKFKGYLSPYNDAAWLAEIGMEQTVKDFNEVIIRGIPDQSVRQGKVYLGGHSLGGYVVGNYACWDFDDNPETPSDAGYNQCAGYFALDTQISATPMAGDLVSTNEEVANLINNIPVNAVKMMRAGTFIRFLHVPGVINPELMNLLSGIGLAAMLYPKTESDSITYLPESQSTNSCLRFYHSRNLAAYLSPKPTILSFRYTNRALLGFFTDNNSMTLAMVRAGVGFFSGGPVAEKQFPLTTDLAEYMSGISALSLIPGIFSGYNLVIPTDNGGCYNDGPLYDWLNYNEISSATIPNDNEGEPWTNPLREVTDINDLARSIAASPLDFTEQYFPMRLIIETVLGTNGAVHANGVSMRPLLEISAGEGPHFTGEEENIPGRVAIPGYSHLDVLTAAPVQNDGEPEKVTTNLLNFIFD